MSLPRGRPRKGCTYDTITKQWMPTEHFNGVAATKTIKKPSKREQFTVHICPPQPQSTSTSLTTEQAALQRRIFEECKRRKELDKLYEETAKKNAEEQRQILEEIAEKERLEKEQKAREAAENEIRLRKEQPRRYAMRLFPVKPHFPVYFMDTDYNMTQLWGECSVQVMSPLSVAPANAKATYDELRDDVWPKLQSLSNAQKELRAKLFKLNKKLNSLKPFAEAAYQKSILQTFVELHLINQRMRLVASRQSELMAASSKEAMPPRH